MKKILVLLVGISTLLIAGCSSQNQTAHHKKVKPVASTKVIKETKGEKQLKKLKEAVNTLFIDNYHKEVDPYDTMDQINKLHEEVYHLSGFKSEKKKLIKDIDYAESHLASAKSSSIQTSKEYSIEEASQKLESEKKDSSSKSKAESKAAVESSKTAESKAEKTLKANQLNSEYPLISSKFNLDQLTDYSSNDLFGKQVRASGTIISLGADSLKQYHILLQINNSDAELLIVEDKKTTGKITEGDNITVYGVTNGKSKITNTQINTGISSMYLNDKIVLFMVDKVSKQS
ncbi:hypothetical protein ACLJJ6_02335 [Pediococcus siamensis]|uniref:hypothetical protein n=1 Tax=Pediococcus siamensis TaxID=381829 RepID=UPI0039A1BDF1